MSVPLYECDVCGAFQPPPEGIETDELAADTLQNVNCRLEYGGCCRLTTLHRIENRTWEPVYWELCCFACQYETVAWGERGFEDSTDWTCPGCETAMRPLTVRQAWEEDGE